RLQLAPRALVCKNSTIEGDVRIGNGTVVHVGAAIIAKNGPIIIGSNNIISERVVIVNNHSTPLTIGDENLLETDARIEGRGMGHRNTVQVRGRVAGTSTLGNNCVVGTMCSTAPNESVPDNTVLFGNPQSRRLRTDGSMELAAHRKHLEYIHDMLPRYNHIIETE
ncbi:trimeric LpxA-like protein, partial [Martensiomyces pterosporus]